MTNEKRRLGRICVLLPAISTSSKSLSSLSQIDANDTKRVMARRQACPRLCRSARHNGQDIDVAGVQGISHASFQHNVNRHNQDLCYNVIPPAQPRKPNEALCPRNQYPAKRETRLTKRQKKRGRKVKSALPNAGKTMA
ncbi:hypothetical protein N658DRAFT_306899 [Parathielavia hyrcaniae]|uniref:Uncharacterized protein n=1 Tax=Parathielavia hyrcaniae TaxID=113614 RepID=A0AAN6T3B3_9PEZI|nr:hypothetical protein N658DRAFT_306899 [Parathielavia hyrcaniae]